MLGTLIKFFKKQIEKISCLPKVSAEREPRLCGKHFVFFAFLTFTPQSFAQSNSNTITGLSVLCTMDSLITQSCGVLDSTAYVYDNQYGPRSISITTPYQTADNATSLTPSLGWHQGDTTINWTAQNLSPENIKSGRKIFGVTGTLSSTPYPDCTYPQLSTDLNSPNNSGNCYVPSGNYYVYSSYLGGRQNACSFLPVDSTTYKILNKVDPANPQGSCWIDTTDTSTADGFNIGSGALKTNGTANFIIRNTPAANSCPVSAEKVGIQNTTCTTPDVTQWTGYFYPNKVIKTINGQTKSIDGIYGGRSKECVYNFNSEPCWIKDAGAIVENNNSCAENSIPNLDSAKNDYSCKVNTTTRTLYTNTNQATSTMGRFIYQLPQGGRNNNCNFTNTAGNCFVNTPFKSDLDPNLIPENIQKGMVIFGVRGTLDDGEVSYGSGAHRQPSSNSNPNRMVYKRNTTGESNILDANPNVAYNSMSAYSTDYNPIPKISSNSESDVTSVDRTGWTNKECGGTGTISARVTDCANTFNGSAQWKGTVKGNAGQSDWELVTRKKDLTVPANTYEVWRDKETGLLWSSLVTSTNWCRASGSNGRQITSGGTSSFDSATSAERDPFNFCNSATYQNQSTPISTCYMDAGDGNGNFLFDTSWNNANTPGKAGLLSNLSIISGRVLWRLPSIYDYMLANHHGLRFVLPDIGQSYDQEWTATTVSSDRKYAWTFSGKNGTRQYKPRNYSAAVRCVGR